MLFDSQVMPKIVEQLGLSVQDFGLATSAKGALTSFFMRHLKGLRIVADDAVDMGFSSMIIMPRCRCRPDAIELPGCLGGWKLWAGADAGRGPPPDGPRHRRPHRRRRHYLPGRCSGNFRFVSCLSSLLNERLFCQTD